MRGYIVGSYGFDNTGDEAILAGLITGLRSRLPNLQLTVMSGNPENTAAAHGVEAVHWQSIPGQFEAVAAADFILVGGGGLFFDYWGFYPETLWTPGHGSLSYVGGAPLLAALLGKPVVYYAVGVGPLRTEEGRRMTRALLDGASSISVREQPSQDLLAELGVPRERVHVAADPAFSLAGDWTTDHRPPREKPVIAVALRPWEVDVEAARWEAAMADALDRYLDRHEAHLKFIPFQWIEHQPLENDYAVAQRIVQAMRHREAVEIAAPQLRPRDRARMLSECDLAVGMRLHSLIFAAMAAAPFVALTYDPKVLHLAAATGCERFVLDLKELQPDRLVEAMEQAWEQRASIEPRLREHTARMAALAAEDAGRLAAELEAGPRPVAPNAEALRTIFTALQGRLRLEGLADTAREAEKRLGEAKAETAAVQSTLDQVRKQLDERERKLAELERQIVAERQAEAVSQKALDAAAKARRYRVAAGLAEAWWSLRQGNVQEAWTRWRAARKIPPNPATPPSVEPKRAVTNPGASSRGTVHVLTPLFFDREGQTMMSGGAERYLLELAPIFRSLGFHVRAYQSARGSWTREYGGIEVCGLDTQGLDGRLNEVFHTQAPPAELTLYHAYYLAAPLCAPRSIGISHGINWDAPEVQTSAEGFANLMEHYRVSIANLERIVSVDTNTINWARATHHHLSGRFRYIPNFVDCTQFHPNQRNAGGRTVVLYPRRLTTHRGFWLAMEVLPGLMAEFPELDVHFVGLAESAREETAVETLRNCFPSRVEWRALSPDRMPEAYAGADITIVPTTSCEGTSLSCLEAMASGNAVIATNAGGLPDLVQDGYNGLLIEPTSEALGAALDKLIRQSRLRRELAAHGVEVARTFQLPVWRERWRALLVEHLTS